MSSPTHFKGLTEIRGVAATTVLLSHIDQFHYLFGTRHLGLSETGLADHAVTVFFVLSGFLITYLLLKERETTGTISAMRFYVRRVLRIWPVYYMAFAAAVILAACGFTSWPGNRLLAMSLLGCMLPNVAFAMEVIFRAAAPLWSVGVEEQFYLLWPWVIRRSKSLVPILIGILVILPLARFALERIDPAGGTLALLRLTRIDCMAFGGLLATVAHGGHHGIQRLVLSPIGQAAGLLMIAIPPILFGSDHEALGMHLVTIGAGIVIFNCALNTKPLIRLDYAPLRWLGIISYGIYAYNMLFIFLLARWMEGAGVFTVFVAITASTLLSATLSYRLVERPLLRLKTRFTVVPSSAD